MQQPSNNIGIDTNLEISFENATLVKMFITAIVLMFISHLFTKLLN
jgi:hypothetical protein